MLFKYFYDLSTSKQKQKQKQKYLTSQQACWPQTICIVFQELTLAHLIALFSCNKSLISHCNKYSTWANVRPDLKQIKKEQPEA